MDLMGYAAEDGEQRLTAGGVAVTSFTLATTFRWRPQGQEEYREQTEWHRVVAFGKLASWALQVVRKGEPLAVEGRLHYTAWTDATGVDRYGVEIIASEINPLRSKADREARASRRAVPA